MLKQIKKRLHLDKYENIIAGIILSIIFVYLSTLNIYCIFLLIIPFIFIIYKSIYFKVKKAVIYVLFGNDLKSDIIFVSIVLAVYLTIHFTFPYLISVVMTTSMEHTNFNIAKYRQYNITLKEFESWPFSHGINQGDLVIIVPVHNPFKDIKVGDVILYRGVYGRPIMHRVIKIIDHKCFVIMGDNNPGPIPYEGENCMPPSRILGKVIFRIPYLGLPKVWISEILRW